MQARSILTGILTLALGGAFGAACDGDKGKTPAKAEAKKGDEKKGGDPKADVKAADAKADAKADEAKAAEAKADGGAEAAADGAAAEAKADGGEAAADGAAAEAKADGGEAAADGGEAKADGGEAKADDAKKDDANKDAGKKDGGKKGGEKKAEPAGPKIDAKGLYLKKCKSCHGVSGKADTKLGEKHDIADWTKPGWKAKWSMKKVENIIINGKSGTKMKAFKDKLTADEIKAVAKYSRSLGK